MELASDSKDFSTALARTRVAEMQGAQVVPLPSSDPRVGLGNVMGQTSSSSQDDGRGKTSSSQDGGRGKTSSSQDGGRGQTSSSRNVQTGPDSNLRDIPKTPHVAALSNATQPQGPLLQPTQTQPASERQTDDYEVCIVI